MYRLETWGWLAFFFSAEGYVENSLENKSLIARKILGDKEVVSKKAKISENEPLNSSDPLPPIAVDIHKAFSSSSSTKIPLI